jgi:hypothetical protein
MNCEYDVIDDMACENDKYDIENEKNEKQKKEKKKKFVLST